MRSSARKRQAKPNGIRNLSLVPDEIHTAQVPCCELVKEVTSDILPEATEKPRTPETDGKARLSASSDPSLFGMLLRNHLVELRKNQIAETLGCKKKRRRKKKKKASDSPTPDESGEGTASLTLNMKIASELGFCKGQNAPGSPSDLPSPFEDSNIPESKNVEVVVGWIDKIIAESPTVTEIPNRNLASFVESIGEVSPTISVDEIADDLHRVACERCKKQAEKYWRSTGIPFHELGIISGNGENMDNRRMYLHPNMISPSHLALPVTGMEDDSFQGAFDYVTLEEGFGPTEEYDEGAWLLQSTIDHATTRPSELVMQQPLDLCGVLRLTRDLILPCGLPAIEDQNSYILTDKEFHSILKRKKELEIPIASKLRDLNAKKDDIQNDLFEIGSSRNQQVDVNLRNSIQEIDKKSESLLSEWLKLLLLLTEHYDNIIDAGWARSKIDHFWKVFSEGLNHIIRESLAHQARLIKIAHPNDVIPLMLLNAESRRSYRIFVEEKFLAVSTLHVKIFPCLAHEEGQESFLKSLLSQEAFSSVVSKESPTGNSGLNQTFAMLLSAYMACATTVEENCHHVSDLLSALEKRTNLLSEILLKAKKALEEEHDLVDGHVPVNCKLRWKVLLQQYDEVVISTMHDQNADDDEIENHHLGRDLSKLHIRSINMASIALTQWRHVREMQRTTSSVPRYGIPARLKEWMKKVDCRYHSTPPDEHDCVGNDGKRRLACIIASLFYKWLVARCKEWHADLIHKELLMDALVLNDVDANELKVKLVNRKKKKKKGIITESLSFETFDGDQTDETLIMQEQTGFKERKTKDASHILLKGMNGSNGSKIGFKVEALTYDAKTVAYDNAWTPVAIKEFKLKLKSPDSLKIVSEPETLPEKSKVGKVEEIKTPSDGESEGHGIAEPFSHTGNLPETTVMSSAEESVEMPLESTKEDYLNKESNGWLQEDDIQMNEVGVTSRNGFKRAEEYLVARFDAVVEKSKKSNKIKVVYL